MFTSWANSSNSFILPGIQRNEKEFHRVSRGQVLVVIAKVLPTKSLTVRTFQLFGSPESSVCQWWGLGLRCDILNTALGVLIQWSVSYYNPKKWYWELLSELVMTQTGQQRLWKETGHRMRVMSPGLFLTGKEDKYLGRRKAVIPLGIWEVILAGRRWLP